MCSEMLYRRGTRRRVWWQGEEDRKTLVIRRLYCEQCNKIHHELPDCLVPYKRYGAEIIENIVMDSLPLKDIPCPADTIRRIRGWWAFVHPYFLNILLTLMEKYGAAFGNPPAFRETVRAVTNANRWIFAHQLCTRSAMRPG